MSREAFIDDVVSSLDGDDFGLGQMEATQRTAENNSRAIGRILWVLMDSGIITERDAQYIIGRRG